MMAIVQKMINRFAAPFYKAMFEILPNQKFTQRKLPFYKAMPNNL